MSKMGEGGYRQINKSLNICAFEDYLTSQMSNLPFIPDVEQISPRVIRVLGQNPGKFTLQGTNTYIIGTGSERLIVDTSQGIQGWADLIETTLSDMGFSLSHVLLTHWHGDHSLGVPQLIALYPDLVDRIYKHSPDRDQQPIVDGQIFRVEGATVRAVHTPGHSHDHMCFIVEEDNAMLTGDNILGHGSTAVEEMSTYMKTLRKMQAQDCQIGYPAHGTVIKDLRTKITGELAQKIRRERQVLRALEQSKTRDRMAGKDKPQGLTVSELVSAIHGRGLDEEVRKLAVEPFIDEVLRKLAEDGAVAFRLRGGKKKWSTL
ncbi:metallo-beta-lactamase domain [Diaporthe eres]|uniref:Metallo-beta-lactamase domain-containing protein n=1 Tax=Diaporthe vaccinii TaxID=105482 RepID=A0ABR4F125_9PEZI|nr:metallo-beta-lactamase domain [Diaporthe eres]